jgi:protein-S-isoprenylcysteine O-methyltransferase Ste14
MGEEAEQKDRATGRFPPPLCHVLTGGVGLGLEWLWPIGMLEGSRVRIGVGVGLALLAFALLGYTVSVLKGSGQEPEPWTPTPSIVDAGPFGWSRNPIYVSMALMHVGVGVALGSVWVLVMVVPACWAVHVFVIRREEAYLERKFGQAYLDYRRRVRPWL